ncbi:MAG: RasGEF domain-containing protein [Gammaproteobacteria bacterium]|nr:RasGEF domain-containing protein [Gammaproteobacteria bacterium]
MEEGKPESFKVKIIGDAGENISAFSALVGDTKNLDVGNQPVTLAVSLDNAFASEVHDRFRGFHGYVVVFDFADAEPYNNVREWLRQIGRHAIGVHRIVLVGLNSDKADPAFDSDAAAEFAANEGLSYIEASASKNRNIDVIFETLAREMDQTLKNKAVEPRVVLDNEKLPLAAKATPEPIVSPSPETKKIDASSVVFTAEVAEIKNNGDLTYLQKLENLAAIRAKNPFPLDEAFMHKFAEGENLNILLDESITVVWKKVQDYNELLEKYKLPNIHASEFSQIQETLKLRAAEEVTAKISEVINGDGTYLSKLKKLKGLYWSYRGLGDVKPTEFTCSEAELNIDQEDNVKALAQLVEYKVLFQLLGIDVANFPVFKNAEENVQRRVQEKYNNDIDAIINGSGSPLEKLKSAKEVFDSNGSNKFLTHEKMAGLVDVLKAIEFSSETNYIYRLAQLKEYQVLCASMKLSQGEAVIKEKIKNLKFDLKADIVFLEIQSIQADQKLSAAEKLSRLNLLLGQCSDHDIKLSSATKVYFNEIVKELSNQVATQLIEASKQKFLDIDWELFSKDPTKTSATKYAADLTMFVQKMILGNMDKVAASLCIGQWLHIANECVKNRDYHSAHAICQAFTTSAVSRVMEMVATEKEKQILEQLRIMFPAKEGDVSRYAIAESAQVDKDVVPSLIYPATQIGNAYAAAEGIGGKADPDVIAKIMFVSQGIQKSSGIPKNKEFNEMQFNEFVSDEGLYALSLETIKRLSDEEKQAEKVKVGGVRKDFDTLSAEDEKELRTLVHPLEVRMLAAQVFKIFDEHASKGVKEKAEKDRKGFVDRIAELDVGKRPKLTEESKSTSSKEINRKIGEIKELLLKAVPGVNNEEFNDKMIGLIQSLELKAQTTKSGEDKKNVIERNVQILRAVAHEFNIDIPKADYLADTSTIEVGALKTPQPSGFFANIQQRITAAGGLVNFVRNIFGDESVTASPTSETPPVAAKEAQEAVVEPSVPSVSVEGNKPEILQSITWNDYWKVYDETKAEIENSLSVKGKEEEQITGPLAIHKKVAEKLKIEILDLNGIANLNRYSFELKVNELVKEGRVKGPTTIETAQKTAVARVMEELVHINNTFYKDFLEIEPKVITFTQDHERDVLVSEFHEMYYAVLNFFNKVTAIAETDPIKKTEIIAQILVEDDGKIAKDIVRFTELKTQVSAKYPQQFTGNTQEARAFDNAVILPSQWVTKAVIVLDAVKKERIDGVDLAFDLFKAAASLANKTESVISEAAVAVELERLVEGTSSTSKIPSAVLNMQAEEVESFLTPQFANLSSIHKTRTLEQVYGLMTAYVEKISGKGGRELNETEVGNIKVILTNLSKLSDFVKRHDPSFAERQKEIPLGNAIGRLKLVGHKELSDQCGKVLIQFNDISISEKVQEATAEPVEKQLSSSTKKDALTQSQPLMPFALKDSPQQRKINSASGIQSRESKRRSELTQTNADLSSLRDFLNAEEKADAGKPKRLRDRSLSEIIGAVIKNPEFAKDVFAKNAPYRSDLLEIVNLHLVQDMISAEGKNGEQLRKIIRDLGLLDSSHFGSGKNAEKKAIWQVYLKVLLDPDKAKDILSSEETKEVLKKNLDDAHKHIEELVNKAAGYNEENVPAFADTGNRDLRLAIITSGILDIFTDKQKLGFISRLKQQFEDVVIEKITTSAQLDEMLKDPSFIEDLKWNPSQIDRLKKIPEVTGEQIKLLDAIYESATNKSGQWCKGDFYVALKAVEFKNEKLQEFLLEKIEVLAKENKLPEVKTRDQADALKGFIEKHLAKASGVANFGNYDAMVKNAPKEIKAIASDLFTLDEKSYIEIRPPKYIEDIEDIEGFTGLDLENWGKVSESPKPQRGEEMFSRDAIEKVFDKVKFAELRGLLLDKLSYQKMNLINSTDLDKLNKVVEELNEKFQGEPPSYEDYRKFLKEYSATVADAFEIEERQYKELHSLGINEVVGGAAAIADANDMVPASSGAPALKKGIFANIFGRNKAEGKKPLFGMDAPLSELEKLVATKEVLEGRDLVRVNRLLDEIRDEANIEREERNDPLYYPVETMTRIVTVLAKHYQTEGLNVEAIQGMFPSTDAVNAYLKAEEAELDQIIDSLDAQEFGQIFSDYFKPTDPVYESFYKQTDGSKGQEAGTYQREVEAYTFRDILKKSFAIGSQEHGGQAGIVRDKPACDAAEEFLRKTESSVDKKIQLIGALLKARAALSVVDRFGAARNALRAEGIDSATVDLAVIGLKTPKQMLDSYGLELKKLIVARVEYVSQKKGIQNQALNKVLEEVKKQLNYFSYDKGFVINANLLISKNAEMPDAFLEKYAEFQKFVIDEVGVQHSPEVLKAIIIAVVKGDISYETNPENVPATIDDNLVKAIRYQLELANAIKKMTDATPLEREALIAEKQVVDEHVKQLSDKLKQMRDDAQKEKRKADAVYERVEISEDELRELNELQEGDVPAAQPNTQTWVRAKRPAQPEPSRYETLTSELQKLLHHPDNIFQAEQTGKIVLRGDQLEGISADFQGTSEPAREVIIRYFGEDERNAINVEDIRERIKFLADVAREYHLDPLGVQQGRINSIQERYIAMCGEGSDFARIGNAAGKEFEGMTVKAQEMFLNMEKELLGIVAPNTSLSKAIKEFENKSKFLLMRRGRPTVIHVMADGLVNVHIPKGKISFPSDFRASENPGTNPNSVLEVIGHVDEHNQLKVQATVSRAVSFSVLKLSKKEQAIQRRRLNYENAKDDITNLLKLMDVEDGQTVTIQSTSLVAPLMNAPTEKATLGRFLGFASETRQLRDHHVALEMVNGETLEVNGKKVTVNINHVNISVKDPKKLKGRANQKEQRLINARGFAKYIENQYDSLTKQFPELGTWLKENCYREATPEIKELEKELRKQYEALKGLVTVTSGPAVQEKVVEGIRKNIRKFEAKLADQYEKLYADVKTQWAKNAPEIPAEFENNKQLQYFVDAQRLYYSGKYIEAGYSYVVATQMARSNELAGVIVAKNCKSTNDRTNWSLNHDKLALKYEEEHNGDPLLSTTPGFEKYVEDHLQVIHEEGAGMDGYTRSRPGARGSVVNNPWGHDPDKRDSLVSKWKIKPGLRQLFKLLLKRDRTLVEESVVRTAEAMREGAPKAEDAMVEATRAAELERKAHAAEASLLRTLDEFERETPARKRVLPKLPTKQAVRSVEASSNAQILAGIENKILLDAMLFQLERKGIDLTKGVDLAAVEKAVKDINAQIPPGEDVMPNEFLKKYAAFLKYAEAIPGINELRSEFFVAVIAQNKSPIKEQDFAARIDSAKTYEDLNTLWDDINKAIKEVDDYTADVSRARDALYEYLPEDNEEVKSLDAEFKRLDDMRKRYVEQNEVVAEARSDILFGARRAVRVNVSMETETVSVEVVRISMVVEETETSKLEKPKQDAAFVYRPSEINPDDRFEKISGKEKITEALKSDDHVIVVKKDSVSYTQPKDTEKLNDQQMRELVQKMVKETYERFKPEKASDITYEGSAELKKIAKELMQAEINRNTLAKEDTAKKAVDPGSPRDFGHRSER